LEQYKVAVQPQSLAHSEPLKIKHYHPIGADESIICPLFILGGMKIGKSKKLIFRREI